MDRFEWVLCALIVCIVVAVIAYMIYDRMNSTPLERCLRDSIILEGNNTIIVFRGNCAELLTNEYNYVLESFNNPSFGPNAYELIKNK